MKRWLLSSVAASTFGTLMPFGAVAEPVFNRIVSFAVPMNLQNDVDQATETSAKMIQATEEGMTLVYAVHPHLALGYRSPAPEPSCPTLS